MLSPRYRAKNAMRDKVKEGGFVLRACGVGGPSEIVDVALTEISPGSCLCCRSFYKDEGSMVFDSHRSCETHDEASNTLRLFDYCHWIPIR